MVSADRAIEWAAKVIVPIPDTREANTMCPRQLVVLVAAGTMLLSFMGCDVDTGLGSCISMLSNIGPGTGTTGPSSNFAHLPAASKWLLSFYMLIGRLEFFTVLFLFMPRFWKERK